MDANWTLHYRPNPDGGTDFAQVMIRGGRSFLRKGWIYTHGEEKLMRRKVNLEAQGYTKARAWVYDPGNPDYSALKSELETAISRVIKKHPGNAFAIVTDFGLMTIGFAVHSFPKIATAADEQLWDVSEWDSWIDDKTLDPAFRWLVAYGFDCEDPELPFEVFEENVVRIFQELLTALPKEWKVRLINVVGHNSGHHWSVPCMDKKLADRMMAWI